MKKIFMPAWSLKEAQEAVKEGFGFETKEEAIVAMSHPEIDPWYKSKYKIYEIREETA